MNNPPLNSQKEKHSMLSLRRATFVGLAAHRLRNISIHALLAESDMYPSQCRTLASDFYPRSPCGERPVRATVRTHIRSNFYPRSPCGERRVLAPQGKAILLFLSTLSLRRATSPHRPAPASVRFLSTLSLRRATVRIVYTTGQFNISIHALLAESDAAV